MHTVLSKEIVLGGGCFWCVEAVFDEINGILTSEVGYSGGQDNPTYKSVSNGDGNIEVVKLTYDPNQISLEKILTIFLKCMIQQARINKVLIKGYNIDQLSFIVMTKI
ncbi:methionine sulfoxide reductase A [Campylobacter insulaenigrae]|nr:methionine sulfoxide reductase A [Campylobacter insulaenigrae]